MASLRPSRYSLSIEDNLHTPATARQGKVLGAASEGLKDVLTTFQQTFVMSDATKQDNPIMFASEGFYKLTGYSARDVIGKNCRFLQGPETDKGEVAKMKQQLIAGEGYCGRLLNYRKDGTPFWNLLTISPVKDESGQVVKWIGMQVEVTKFTEGKADESKRPNQLPVSLIRYDARQKEEAETNVAELVQALQDPKTGGIEKLELLEGKEEPEAEDTTSTTKDPPKRRRNSIGSLTSMLSKSGRKSQEETKVPAQEEAAPAVSEPEPEPEVEDDEGPGDPRARHGIDLATTLERIQKNFVITDPRLPDNPIIFASDDFLELTEYSREEILGKNCRFLQGKDTDPATVLKIRNAIHNAEDITVQLLNYTKSGKPFWNLFHLQAVRDSKGSLQYFIGVQLDASTYIEPNAMQLAESFAAEGTVEITQTAGNVDVGLQELPDVGQTLESLFSLHSKLVAPLPHGSHDSNWAAISKAKGPHGRLGLKHFRPIKPLGCGDTGSVHLVELRDTGKLFAMKAMDKEVMVNRNKVHRACTEREILGRLDHPFLPTLYGSFETATHICLITNFCPGGELYTLLERQKGKRIPEEVARFYAAEVLLALEYLHTQGIIYRDLKPENILLGPKGHVLLTDFDLSYVSTTAPELGPPRKVPQPSVVQPTRRKKKASNKKETPELALPRLVVKPTGTSNSFVGTEEYIAPEIISGIGHSSMVDWWAFGIFLYEMLYGRTPFRGKNRQRTFTNILMKDLAFPNKPEVSLQAKLLMKALLERDPTMRLGATYGATDIKEHAFFNGMKWPLVRGEKVPTSEVPIKYISASTEQDRVSTSQEPEELEWEDCESRDNSLAIGRDSETF